MAAMIVVRDLRKTFRIGFFRKRVEAVRGITFEVQENEIFGFLGPNGAGKTTTIKILTGLIASTEGEASILGRRAPSPEAMRDVGFLPENPYIYPYLTPREFVELSGRLSGLRGKALRARALDVLTKVGMRHAADRPVRRISKGMLQRTGLAAALVADPRMLLLDEPMSGLDPVGRKEVRDIIFEERAAGRTIFFSTHILSDVEAMCDRVTLLREGKVVLSGAIRELLRKDVLRTDVTLGAAPESLRRALVDEGYAISERGGVVLVEVQGEAGVHDVLRRALDAGAQIVEVVPRKETLEDLFMQRALGTAEQENDGGRSGAGEDPHGDGAAREGDGRETGARVAAGGGR